MSCIWYHVTKPRQRKRQMELDSLSSLALPFAWSYDPLPWSYEVQLLLQFLWFPCVCGLQGESVAVNAASSMRTSIELLRGRMITAACFLCWDVTMVGSSTANCWKEVNWYLSPPLATVLTPNTGYWITSWALKFRFKRPSHWWRMFPWAIISLNVETNAWQRLIFGLRRTQPLSNKKSMATKTAMMVHALLPDWLATFD